MCGRDVPATGIVDNDGYRQASMRAALLDLDARSSVEGIFDQPDIAAG
ncbi:hypothetical protein [Thioalkalivibrio sp. HK1]|nr:hypothetical protein [Thioalkalivibrio sp. HK1]